jgi:hypothetical protein
MNIGGGEKFFCFSVWILPATIPTYQKRDGGGCPESGCINLVSLLFQTGELQTNSALNLIVFGTKLEHLDLIEYVVVDLLNAKYNTFVKRVFRRQMIVFLLFFCLSSFCFITRPNQAGQDRCTMWPLHIPSQKLSFHIFEFSVIFYKFFGVYTVSMLLFSFIFLVN